MTSAERQGERIRRLAARLREAERPLRVLRTLGWPPEVRERFLAEGGRELPRVAYQPPDPGPTLEAVAAIRRDLADRPADADAGPDDGGALVDAWLERQAEVIATAAQMLAAVGTRRFYDLSRQLYGAPTDPLADQVTTSLELARLLDDTLSGLTHTDLGAPSPACYLAEGVAAEIRRAVGVHFGAHAPEVVVVEHLSANALAEQGVIRIRRTAAFTDRDVHQLIQHEAFVHAATSINGQAQDALPILAAGHPGTTRTQEGLAVFAELISGAMDPDRLRRLGDRVLAIQMAIDGADFLEVYRFFLGRVLEPEQAFENARRVFRGGVLTGGAPFTKDVVYLDGLLRVHNFLRAVVLAERTDCLRLLFCGKLDVDDVPALGHLAVAGLCRPPLFLPPWAADRRFLVSYLAYSAFLNRVDPAKVRGHFQQLLAATPRLTSETFC